MTNLSQAGAPHGPSFDVTADAFGGIDRTTRIASGLAALVLGAFFVFGVGFAHSAALHDTAHDIRHSYGFPCH